MVLNDLPLSPARILSTSDLENEYDDVSRLELLVQPLRVEALTVHEGLDPQAQLSILRKQTMLDPNDLFVQALQATTDRAGCYFKPSGAGPRRAHTITSPHNHRVPGFPK